MMKLLKNKLKISVSAFETKEGTFVYKFCTNSVIPHILKEKIAADIDYYLNGENHGKS